MTRQATRERHLPFVQQRGRMEGGELRVRNAKWLDGTDVGKICHGDVDLAPVDPLGGGSG